MNHLTVNCFKLLSILQILSLISLSLGSNQYISLFSLAQYICSYLLLSCVYLTRMSPIRNKSKNVLYLIIYVILCAVMTGLSYSSFVDIFVFISMLTIWLIYDKIKFKGIHSFLLKTIYVLFIVIVYAANSSKAYNYVVNIGEYEGQVLVGEKLSLGLNNPNEAGTFLFFMISIMFSLSLSINSIFKRYLTWTAVTYMIYLLFLTDSRSSLISVIVIFAFYIIDYKKRIISSSVLTKDIVLFSPLLFAILYVVLSSNNVLLASEFMGKPLFSGREESFLDYYSILKQNLLVGNVVKYGFENMLNLYITLVANIGIIGLSLYIICTRNVLIKLSQQERSATPLFAYISILGMYFNACTESSFMVSGGKWYFFILTLFVIANSKSIKA